MFFDEYKYWCDKKGVSPNKAAVECGISESSPSVWKSKGMTPNARNLQKLVEYFGISAEQLLDHTKADNQSLAPSFDGEIITRTAKSQPNRVQEVFGEKITFIAKDNAMIFDCIPNGATLTLNPHFDLENGDIIVACIDDEFYCRRYSADGNNVTLYSSNPKYPPIFTTKATLYKSGNGILGVVKKVSFEI